MNSLTLFDLSPHPRHRHTDPTTSAQACRSVTATHTETAILTAFRHAPAGLTDDELATLLAPTHYPPTTKTARSRLSGRGLLVDTGLRRLSLRGRDMVVWGQAR